MTCSALEFKRVSGRRTSACHRTSPSGCHCRKPCWSVEARHGVGTSEVCRTRERTGGRQIGLRPSHAVMGGRSVPRFASWQRHVPSPAGIAFAARERQKRFLGLQAARRTLSGHCLAQLVGIFSDPASRLPASRWAQGCPRCRTEQSTSQKRKATCEISALQRPVSVATPSLWHMNCGDALGRQR